MSAIRKEIIWNAINKSKALTDYNIYNKQDKRFEFRKQTILADDSLTEDEKTYAIKILNKTHDRNKVNYNSGTKRICENCNQGCLATLYCEYCVRNYLKANFSNWTSGNDNIDNLIQRCQTGTIDPEGIIEWIPYNNFQNIKYLTKGGYSEIYKANWINGRYKIWDSDKRQLKRKGRQRVILKRLENAENANQRWFEEAKSHLTISNKWSEIVQCYGLTKDPSNGDYMLVMEKMDVDLRKYLQQNHNQLTWKERIQNIHDIVRSISKIHKAKAIHRDLHSGNLLHSPRSNRWFISDLGFCGPADKPSNSIYGNLPYIAPEVIAGKQTTFKSDIYSIAMLMWEISSGQPPFNNYEHDYYLATNIINGIRPKVVPGTPLEYEGLMKQCWDADPLKRPDIRTLRREIRKIRFVYYQNESNESTQSKVNSNSEANKQSMNYTISRLLTSKIHRFENFPEPRNATADEQEAFHSKSYDDFHIPDNIDDFGKSSKEKNDSTSKISSISKDTPIQQIQQQIKKHHIDEFRMNIHESRILFK
ncbi:kinase-like domain-containing protein [Glomus cerebriforme]|uniref:Kinase-like domain-containing protein n=1 Tax=Glomus cerebriforme TaxID=658196 RepID=A0A397STR9_9GLOM|nr:kinase-like domain-containing protein [Glomus cerebriforme]